MHGVVVGAWTYLAAGVPPSKPNRANVRSPSSHVGYTEGEIRVSVQVEANDAQRRAVPWGERTRGGRGHGRSRACGEVKVASLLSCISCSCISCSLVTLSTMGKHLGNTRATSVTSGCACLCVRTALCVSLPRIRSDGACVEVVTFGQRTVGKRKIYNNIWDVSPKFSLRSAATVSVCRLPLLSYRTSELSFVTILNCTGPSSSRHTYSCVMASLSCVTHLSSIVVRIFLPL